MLSATSNPLARLDAAFLRGILPPENLSVSEWADKYRVLSSKGAAEPGRWRTDRTPYMRAIMDAWSDPAIETIVVMAAAQIGKTESGNNCIGYTIHHSPGPFLAVQPTVEMAKRFSKQRIDGMISDSPALCDLVSEPRSRDSGNTIQQKDFPGGTLVMTGANSAKGLRSMPVKYLMLDEIDGYPSDVEGEGDPVNLAIARTRTFPRRKILMVSTPSIAGRSRIERAYNESDQRQYWVPCPRCGEYQVLVWAQMRWPDGEPAKAVYECIACSRSIANHEKTEMLRNGEWRKSHTLQQLSIDSPARSVHSRVAGFHLNGLYSPVGWLSWGQCAEQFVRGSKEVGLLKVFVNTVLAEPFIDKGEAPEWERLYERREDYPTGVPRGGVFITAGVDVQADRIEMQVVAWGRNNESWLVDYVVISGDTSRAEVWHRLTTAIGESYRHESGADLPIAKIAIDSGYATTEVYEWARHQGHRVIVTKGDVRSPGLVGLPSAVEVSAAGKRARFGLRVWPIDTNAAKAELYRWLKQAGPIDGQSAPPGYCHFSKRQDAEFFRQLTAEQIVVRVVRGYQKVEWQKTYSRNEALDTRVYARAAAIVHGVNRWSESTWEEMEKSLVKSVVKEPHIVVKSPQSNESSWFAGTEDWFGSNHR